MIEPDVHGQAQQGKQSHRRVSPGGAANDPSSTQQERRNESAERPQATDDADGRARLFCEHERDDLEHAAVAESGRRADDQDHGEESGERSGWRKAERLKPPTAIVAMEIEVIKPAPNLSASQPPMGRITVAIAAAHGAKSRGLGRSPGCRRKDLLDDERQRCAHGDETAERQEIEKRKHPGVQPFARHELGSERLGPAG